MKKLISILACLVFIPALALADICSDINKSYDNLTAQALKLTEDAIRLTVDPIEKDLLWQNYLLYKAQLEMEREAALASSGCLTPTDPLPPPDDGTSPGTDPGTNPDSDPGTDPGSEPGTDPTTDPGTDPNTDPGSEPVTDPGTDPSTDPGSEPGTDPNPDPGTDPSTDPGTEPGSNPNPDPGTDPSTDPGTEPGSDPNPDPGTDPSTDPGTKPGNGKGPKTCLRWETRNIEVPCQPNINPGNPGNPSDPGNTIDCREELKRYGQKVKEQTQNGIRGRDIEVLKEYSIRIGCGWPPAHGKRIKADKVGPGAQSNHRNGAEKCYEEVRECVEWSK